MKARIKEILIFVGLSTVMGCVEQPENVSPCAKMFTPGGEFTISEFSYLKNPYSREITKKGQNLFLVRSTMYLNVKDTNATTNTWKFARSGDEYNGKSLRFYFSFEDSNIVDQISLTSEYKKLNYDCFKYTDTIFRSQKTFKIVNDNEAYYYGKWEGHYIDKPDSVFVIDVKPVLEYQFTEWTPTKGVYYVYVENFPLGCSKIYLNHSSNGYGSISLIAKNTYQYSVFMRPRYYFDKTFDCFGFSKYYIEDSLTFQVHQDIDSMTVYINKNQLSYKTQFKAKRVK